MLGSDFIAKGALRLGHGLHLRMLFALVEFRGQAPWGLGLGFVRGPRFAAMGIVRLCSRLRLVAW